MRNVIQLAHVSLDGYLAGPGGEMDFISSKASAKGTRVRRMAKQRFVVDGPFAESKELVGGYMIVQTRSLDEAFEVIRPWLRIRRIGQRAPSSAIEVRRLL